MSDKNMRLGINMNFENVREDSPQFRCVCDKVDFMVAHTDPQNAPLPVSIEKTRAAAKLLDAGSTTLPILNTRTSSTTPLRRTAPNGF